MPSIFGGVENFSPALEGQRIAIGAGAAMRQGLQGIEQVGQEQKMMKWLDKFANDLNFDYAQKKKGSSQYPGNAAPPPGSPQEFYGSW